MSRAPAAKGARDSNHGEIAQAYRDMGCSVHDTSMVGWGFPDLTVGLAGVAGRVTELVEVKTQGGTPNAAQKLFTEVWRGSPVRTVRNIEDVIAHVTEVRNARRSA